MRSHMIAAPDAIVFVIASLSSTACTAYSGLGSGSPGREIEGPMAVVILGGLTTSTALNLLVLPTLALRSGRFGF